MSNVTENQSKSDPLLSPSQLSDATPAINDIFTLSTTCNKYKTSIQFETSPSDAEPQIAFLQFELQIEGIVEQL